MKKALRETQTLHASCSKAEPKIFTSLQTPFLGERDGQNLISWGWSLPSPTSPVRWGSMHAMSSYRGNRPTNTHTHKQTGPITIHCTTASAVCNNNNKYWVNSQSIHLKNFIAICPWVLSSYFSLSDTRQASVNPRLCCSLVPVLSLQLHSFTRPWENWMSATHSKNLTISNGLISRFLSSTCTEVSGAENIGQCGRLSQLSWLLDAL